MNKSSSKGSWAITQDDFDRLLKWLDPDRARAGEKYENIYHVLIKIFSWSGCSDPEGLADETINRVIHRLPEIVDSYVGDPSLYFYGVAKNVIREYRRQSGPMPLASGLDLRDEPSDKIPELALDCLDRCLGMLSAQNRELITKYYSIDKKERAVDIKGLSAESGLSINALRISLHQIRTKLEKCVRKCIEEKGVLPE